MKFFIHQDGSALILRLALGIMYVAHGFTKLFVFTPAGTVHYFSSLGMPAIFAYLTIIFEVLGGFVLIIGIGSRWIALMAAIQMVVIAFVHAPNGWSFSSPGGGWEYPVFMGLTALALTGLGDGKYSLCAKFKGR